MIIKLHCVDDSLVLENDSIEELRKEALYETNKRGWNADDCWSEVIER